MLARTKKRKKRKLCSSLVCNSVSSFDLHSLYIEELQSSLLDYLAKEINGKNYPIKFYCIFHLD